MTTAYARDRGGTGALPPVSELLGAFRSMAEVTGEHPVLTAARALVHCHRARRAAHLDGRDPHISGAELADRTRRLAELDGERDNLVARIDNWVADNVEHRDGASLHTETLGAVIDRMAGKWVAAQDALGFPADDPGPDTPVGPVPGEGHLHWVRLAELADGYQDLIIDIAEHRRRLPVF
ncbi:MAG: DUF4254 domain-containing protein [Nocardia sp.]|nr:DUF4254 domain-containing protein [Nocardia sp.]